MQPEQDRRRSKIDAGRGSTPTKYITVDGYSLALADTARRCMPPECVGLEETFEESCAVPLLAILELFQPLPLGVERVHEWLDFLGVFLQDQGGCKHDCAQ